MYVDTGEGAIEPGKPAERTAADAASTWLVSRKRGPIDQQRLETVRGQRPRCDGACRPGTGDDDVGVHGHQPTPSAGPTGSDAVTVGSIGGAQEASAVCPASAVRCGRRVRPPRR